MPKDLLKRFNSRPFSYSQYACFKWNKEDWYKKYVLNEKEEPSPELVFGKLLAESIEAGKPLAPVTILPECEHEFKFKISGIKCIGYADGFDPETKRKIAEYKSGVAAWDYNRVKGHKQIDFYLLGNYIIDKVPPEEVEVFLEWIPTKKISKAKTGLSNGEYAIEFVQPIEVRHFKTSRTMADIINFGAEIKKTVEEMHNYILTRN